MSTLNDAPNRYKNEALIFEMHPALCRRVVTIASGQNLKSGTILGTITTGSKRTRVNLGASDGSQTATEVLAEDADASGGDVQAEVFYRFAVFNGAELGYNTGATSGNITTINGQLASANIAVLPGV